MKKAIVIALAVVSILLTYAASHVGESLTFNSSVLPTPTMSVTDAPLNEAPPWPVWTTIRNWLNQFRGWW